MTIIVGFANQNCTIVGIDGLVTQTRVYSDGSSEQAQILRNKLGSFDQRIFVAHQGRISSRSKKDYSTQDICDKINLDQAQSFEGQCQSIILGFSPYLDKNQDNILVIAGKNTILPTLCTYEQKRGKPEFSKKTIFVSNAGAFAQLEAEGKVTRPNGDYNSISCKDARQWVEDTVRAFIKKFKQYGGPPWVGVVT